MSGYLFLVPVSLALGLLGLGAFLWSLRHEQYDDLDGAAERVLFAEDRPIVDAPSSARGGEPSPARGDDDPPGSDVDVDSPDGTVLDEHRRAAGKDRLESS